MMNTNPKKASPEDQIALEAKALIKACERRAYDLPTRIIEVQGDPASVMQQVIDELALLQGLQVSNEQSAIHERISTLFDEFAGAMHSGFVNCKIMYQDRPNDIIETVRDGQTRQYLAFTEHGQIVDSGIQGRDRHLTLGSGGYKVDDMEAFTRPLHQKHILLELVAKTARDDIAADIDVTSSLGLGSASDIGVPTEDIALKDAASLVMADLPAEMPAAQNDNAVIAAMPAEAIYTTPNPVQTAAISADTSPMISTSELTGKHSPSISSAASAIAPTPELTARLSPAVVERAFTQVAKEILAPRAEIANMPPPAYRTSAVAPRVYNPSAFTPSVSRNSAPQNYYQAPPAAEAPKVASAINAPQADQTYSAARSEPPSDSAQPKQEAAKPQDIVPKEAEKPNEEKPPELIIFSAPRVAASAITLSMGSGGGSVGQSGSSAPVAQLAVEAFTSVAVTPVAREPANDVTATADANVAKEEPKPDNVTVIITAPQQSVNPSAPIVAAMPSAPSPSETITAPEPAPQPQPVVVPEEIIKDKTPGPIIMPTYEYKNQPETPKDTGPSGPCGGCQTRNCGKCGLAFNGEAHPTRSEEERLALVKQRAEERAARKAAEAAAAAPTLKAA